MDDHYVDPTQPDPQFPNRPTHPDFARLSNVIQGMDMRSGVASVPEITGVDDDSLLYAIDMRLQILGQLTNGAIQNNTLMKALYLDAFALGKLYAEAPR